MPRRNRSSRKNGMGLVSKLYSPFGHLFKATGNSVRNVSRGVGNVAGKVVGTANKIGSTYARETNRAISNITRGRKSRRGTRKGSRRSSRR